MVMAPATLVYYGTLQHDTLQQDPNHGPNRYFPDILSKM